MGTRELLILILGLAVVAVILRGLFVALQARRSQIRLAIDKNIPHDLDLEELEMAELPSGGARVVQRSLAEVNRYNTVQNELDLAVEHGEVGQSDQEPVPILLDPVTIHEQASQSDDHEIAEHQINAAVEETSIASQQVEEELQESPVEPVFQPLAVDDYVSSDVQELEIENLQELEEELATDFTEQDKPAVEEHAPVTFESAPGDEFDEPAKEWATDAIETNTGADEFGFGFDPSAEQEEPESPDRENTISSDDEMLPAQEHQTEEVEEFLATEERQEPELGFDESLEEGIDEFSLSAGERIGAPELESVAEPAPLETKVDSSAEKKPRKNSLFSRLGRKDKDRAVSEAVENSYDDERDPLFSPSSDSSFAEDSNSTSRPSQQTPAESDAAEVADFNQARESRRPSSFNSGNKSAAAPQKPEPRRDVAPAEVLVVNVMSREGELFRGPELYQVLVTAGLKHGDMNIFHRHLDNNPASPVIFSVANILNPGTFDLDRLEELNTRGISLFLAMPAVIGNRDAFEEMLLVAQQIRAALDGELRDDHRSVMTAQTIEHYRQRIHDYELRKLKAAQARS